MSPNLNSNNVASRQLYRRTKPYLLVAAVLFLLVQYASILHAAEHPFHTDAASCDVFVSVDKSKAKLDPCSMYTAGYVIGEISSAEPRPIPVTVRVAVYLSRAPPVTPA